MEYFSDTERGPRSRTQEVISPTAWGGLVATINMLVSTGGLAAAYPERCADGGLWATDADALALAVKGEMLDLDWPLQTTQRSQEGFFSEDLPYAPDTYAILDLVQFVYLKVGKPLQLTFHKSYGHYHLGFDIEAGKQEYRDDVNRIFARNGLAYELQSNGRVIRLLPHILGPELASTLFNTGERTLDEMLEESRTKFSNPDTSVRREAMERLWDCWERLKSMEATDKRQSVEKLLDQAANEPAFRRLIDDEARTLTSIGNSFHIRHSEVGKTPVTDSEHIDYLYHRLFALLRLLLDKRRVQ